MENGNLYLYIYAECYKQKMFLLYANHNSSKFHHFSITKKEATYEQGKWKLEIEILEFTVLAKKSRDMISKTGKAKSN